MSLRLRINLMIGALMLAFIASMLITQIISTRRGVQEEVAASNTVANRLFSAFIATSPGRASDPQAMRSFLQQLGRLRSTELTFRSADGELLYHSPSSTYKAGRDAPQWFARLVGPRQMHQQFAIGGGSLLIESNASRAILDGWDDSLRLVLIGMITLALLQPSVLWLVGRATRPLRRILVGLQSMERGAYHTRLPPLNSAEAEAIGQAFNRMAHSIEDNLYARRDATEAQLHLRQSREVAQQVEQRMEDERRQIARELHDETSQSVTAIRSLAKSLLNRAGDEHSAQIARAISDAASQLHADVHEMIPRLRPLALDNLGLADALQNQVDDWRAQNPQLQFSLQLGDLPAVLNPAVTLAAFRVLQEACSNALRHAQATHIALSLHGDGAHLNLQVLDDGIGIKDGWQQRRDRGFGIRGMIERVQSLGGEFVIEAGKTGGTILRARLPLVPVK
jgi:two-component system sensor histidine kinase UhpB